MNPLAPALMSTAERRTALCAILALGLIRLKQRNASDLSAENGESSLHSAPDQWRHATPTHRRNA